MRFFARLFGVFWAAVQTLGAVALVVFGIAFINELGISLPSEKRTYPEAPAAVALTPNLDRASSTTVPGLTDAERMERMLRATVMVVTGGRSLGSGVIVDNQGCYVVTNEHVIDTPGDIFVTYITRFRDDGSAVKRRVAAEIMGLPSADNDLALLKMASCEGTVWAPIGDSDALRHGNVVTAIGHPKGEDWTLTQGVVSQPRRTMEDVTNASGWELIQIDAASNSGNSGGPLFNLAGEVVGINSLKRTDGESLGFARPANLVDTYLTYLAHYGQMPKILLGVVVSTVPESEAQSAGIPASFIANGDFGLLVVDIAEGGTAEQIGLRAGDVLLAVNGDGVYDVHRFKRLLYRHTPHGPMDLTVLRDGTLVTITATAR